MPTDESYAGAPTGTQSDTQTNTTDQSDTDTTSDDAREDSDAHATPVDLARALREAVGGMFDVDPCSGCEPIPIAETRYTIEDDGLAVDSPWYGSVFINPPYSNPAPWLDKTVRVIESGDADYVVMLLPSYSTSTDYFQTHAPKADYLCTLDGRLTFHGSKNSAGFASIILIWAADDADVPDALLDELSDRGELFTHEGVDAATVQLRFEEFMDTATADADSGPVTPSTPDDAPLTGLAVGDLVTVAYDADSPMFPSESEITSTPTVRVLTGRTNGDRVEVLCLSPDVPWNEGETYHLLTFDADNPWDIRAAADLDTWRQIPLNSVTRAVTTGHTNIGQYVV